jgi:hypothetical protein
MVFQSIRNLRHVDSNCILWEIHSISAMIFTICKQCVNQKMSWANQNQLCVNFFPYIVCKPQNLGDSKEFCKILNHNSLFWWGYYVPHIPGSIRWSHFFGPKKSLHCQKNITRFTLLCPPMIRSSAISGGGHSRLTWWLMRCMLVKRITIASPPWAKRLGAPIRPRKTRPTSRNIWFSSTFGPNWPTSVELQVSERLSPRRLVWSVRAVCIERKAQSADSALRKSSSAVRQERLWWKAGSDGLRLRHDRVSLRLFSGQVRMR